MATVGCAASSAAVRAMLHSSNLAIPFSKRLVAIPHPQHSNRPKHAPVLTAVEVHGRHHAPQTQRRLLVRQVSHTITEGGNHGRAVNVERVQICAFAFAHAADSVSLRWNARETMQLIGE